MPDDGFRYELVRGELRKTSPAGFRHGRIAHRVALSLGRHAEAKGLGAVTAAETGFKLSADPDTVRAPDVAFVQQKRLEGREDLEGYWPGAPDLAVEVVSARDRYAEVDAKVGDWLEAGVRMIVVNPRKRGATVYRSRQDGGVLTEDDAIDGADVVPGWRLPLKELFA